MIDTKALRSRVLDLAIQGKLTEQLESDGTAEELYAQIQEVKAKLIKEGKIKKEKPLPEITAVEVPFEIPGNWKWVRLGNIVTVLGGKRIPAGRKLTSENTGHKYIRVSDMKNMTVDTTNLLFVPEDVYPKISNYIINKDDVYITVAGTIGKVGTIPDEIDGANLTENADRLVFISLNKYWLTYCLSTGVVQKQITFLTTQVAQPKLAIKRIQEFYISLPPLAEQKRIVERVEHIFKLLDTIDEAQAKYSADVDVLRQKLITAGIQSKLTEQLDSDGTAEELYAQIQEEKAELIKAGKIKKEKPLPEITADEIPFEIPSNWKWVRFGDIMWNRDSERIPVSVADRKKLKKIYDYYGASGVIDKVEEYLFDKRLLLIGEDGANLLSRSTPIAFIADGKYWVNNHAHVLDCYIDNYLDFVMFYINSISLVPYVTGSAQPKLNQDRMNRIPIPLPPLAEQKRIADTLDKLLGVLG